jgi:phosphonate transport system ATP-binding protein
MSEVEETPAGRSNLALISLRDLEVTFPGGTRAIAHITLDILPGQFIVLLGRSGAGKSTLLRTLNCLVKPTGGRLAVADIGEFSSPQAVQDLRRQTAMIFQLHHLIGRHTALKNVLMGRLAHHTVWRTLLPLPRRDMRLALECLERVGLGALALKRVDQLSGGERQRVGIARALAQQPRVILADEPVASLDQGNARVVLTLLRQICREDGLTVVVSLHQLEYAREFGARVIALSKGEVVFDGASDQLSAELLEHIYEAPNADGLAKSREPAVAVRKTNGRTEHEKKLPAPVTYS